MRKPLAALALLGVCLSMSSCKRIESWQNSIDTLSFNLTGGTLFSEPFQVTTKQLHFDTGELFGKDIIIEGKIFAIGDASTHVILSDPDGRMLIVTTEIIDSYEKLIGKDFGHIRVLGILERGKKGLPYITAKAIRVRGRYENETVAH